jgi:hypothetical protein
MTNYQLVKGPDGITWLSLEPLMNDMKSALILLMSLDLPEEEEQGRNEKILGIKATFEILGALVQEANLAEARKATLRNDQTTN